MPRDGSGVYSKPAGTTASPNTTIESSKYNSVVDDLVMDANAARPITAGGTGATTAAAARTALGVPGLSTITQEPQGRLTLTTALPVTTSDVVAATSIFYTPYVGNTLPIWDGSAAYASQVFSELTLALDSNSGHTGYHAVDTNFDLFVISDAGTLRLGTGPAWSNSGGGTSTRGTGAGTTELERKSGIWTNKVTISIRFGSASGNTVSVAANLATYVGTFRASGNGQASDRQQIRTLWNCYNRVEKALLKTDTTDSWVYSVASYRAANNDGNNCVTFIRGLSEDLMTVTALGFASNDTGTPRSVFAGIGVNSVTVNGGTINVPASVSQLTLASPSSTYIGTPTIGYSVLTWLERGNGTDTQTWRGDAADSTLIQTGVFGRIRV